MAWIESHQSLRDHPKTRRLSRHVGHSLPATIGYLHMFWWWAMDYAQDGNLSRYSADDIEDAVDWKGERGEFWSGLLVAGFVDETGTIHDWDDYVGRLIDRRNANKQRQREYRERRNAHVTRDSGVTNDATVPNQTVPNQTVPNQTVPEGGLGETKAPEPQPVTPAAQAKPKTRPLSSRQKGEILLADDEFMATIRERFTSLSPPNFEYQCEKWLDHIQTKPPKGNYKNSLRNWLENAVKFAKEANREADTGRYSAGRRQTPRSFVPAGGPDPNELRGILGWDSGRVAGTPG